MICLTLKCENPKPIGLSENKVFSKKIYKNMQIQFIFLQILDPF